MYNTEFERRIKESNDLIALALYRQVPNLGGAESASGTCVVSRARCTSAPGKSNPLNSSVALKRDDRWWVVWT